MTIDKPLKFYLVISSAFIVSLSVFYWATDKPEPVPEDTFVLYADDPLVQKAKKLAVLNLDTLKLYYPNFLNKTFIMFSQSGNKEGHIWGQLISWDANILNVEISSEDQGKAMASINTNEIEDWIIEIDDQKIRGGFTSQVILIREKRYKRPEEAYDDPELQQFVDRLVD